MVAFFFVGLFLLLWASLLESFSFGSIDLGLHSFVFLLVDIFDFLVEGFDFFSLLIQNFSMIVLRRLHKSLILWFDVWKF